MALPARLVSTSPTASASLAFMAAARLAAVGWDAVSTGTSLVARLKAVESGLTISK